ncbi:MAG: hypothetical protein AAGI15_01620 [Pseudomonadota bacterium]
MSDTPGTIGKLKARYGGLTLRERAIITVALLGTTWCLWLITASDYLTSRESEMTRQVRQTEVELRLATEEQQRLRRARSADPNDALRAEKAAVKAGLERLDASMANSLSRFVPPERMSELLADLLAEHRGLKLKLVRRLPSRALVGGGGDQAAVDGDDEAKPSAGDRGPAPPNLYLHPLRLEVEGRYFDVLGYVQALEDSPWRFNWRRFDYETATYPRGRAVIEIETLSRDPRWLGV